MLDVHDTWQIGPFLVEVKITGEEGPWLTSDDIHRRFSSFAHHGPSDHLQPLHLEMTTDWDAWPRDGELVPSLEVRPDPETAHHWRLRRTDLWGNLVWAPNAPLTIVGAMAPQGLVVEECLRLMMWLSLAGSGATDGVLIHSSCAVHDGQAYCFPAHSGTGKSTLVRLAPGDLPLNDELTLLTRRNGGWWAWPVPFWNWQAQPRPGTNATQPFPLRAIGLLAQSPQSRWEPLEPGVALFPLMEQVVAFQTFASETGRTFELAADLVEALSSTGKLGRMHLLKGDAPYPFI